jgi:hypothetical protein
MPRQFSRLVGTQLGKLIFFGSEANMTIYNVRFTPKSGHCGAQLGCPLCAKSGHRQAAGAFAEAVIRSVELIVQPNAHDVVGEMRVRGDAVVRAACQTARAVCYGHAGRVNAKTKVQTCRLSQPTRRAE